MRWSKLRKLLKDFIIPELQNRVDFHYTRYHDAHDDAGEAWITIDKVKIIGGGYYHWMVTKNPLDEAGEELMIRYGYHEDFSNVHIENKKIENVMRLGLHDTHHLVHSLFNYLNTPFDECLSSNNPFYRALSLIDRRLGKRRFDKIEIKNDDHILIKRFYQLRKECFKHK